MPHTFLPAGGGRMAFASRWLAAAMILACCATSALAATDEPYDASDTVNAGNWYDKDIIIGPGATGGPGTADVLVQIVGNTFVAGDNPATGMASSLTIESNDDYTAELRIADTVSPKPIVIDNDAAIIGTENKGAALTISGSGNDLLVNGFTDMYGHSSLVVEDGGLLRTGGLFMRDDTGAAGVTVTATVDDARLIVTGSAYVYDNSSLTITNGGSARFKGGLYVDGENATLALDDGHVSLAKNSQLVVGGLYGGALLTVTGTSSIGYQPPSAYPDPYYNMYPANPLLPATETEPVGDAEFGVFIDEGGRLDIAAAGELTIDRLYVTSAGYNGAPGANIAGTGALLADTLVLYETGTMNVRAGADLKGNNILLGDSAVLTVSGTISEKTIGGSGNAIAVSGGTLNLESGASIDFPLLNASGGAVNVKAGSTVDIASFEAAGTSKVNVDGTIKAGNDFSVGGAATVNFSGTANIGEAAGLGHLRVGGSGVLNLATGVAADEFTFSGGSINMEWGSSLTLGAPASGAYSTMTGDLYFYDGAATVNFQGDVEFGRGGIHAMNGVTGHVSLSDGTDSHALTIGKNAVLDTAGGFLDISGVSNFTLNGTLNVGYAGSDVLLTAISGIDAAGGKLEIGGDATVSMTDSMQRQALASMGAGGLQVFLTDATDAGGKSILEWDNTRGITFSYEVVKDLVTGEYSIWVTGAQAADRSELAAEVRKNWRKEKAVGDYVDSIINDGFLDAILDANNLTIGVEPGYDTLTSSGKFNADALASLVNPAQSGAGYDALMLYNGSNLAMANQAVMASNQQILRHINRRGENLRREIRGNDLVDPDSDCPPPLPTNRFWADAIYHSDISSRAKGFNGYSYRGLGLVVGHDKLYGDLAVGGAASYLGGDFKDASALSNNSRIDTFAADLYATLTHPSGWFAAGALGYSYSDNRLRDRRVLNGITGWNHADYGSHTLSVSASVGRDFWIGDYLTLSPSIGFDYLDTRSGSHTQYFIGNDRAGGANTLAATTVKNHSMRAPLNLAMSYNVAGDEETLFTLTGNVGYAYEFNDTGPRGDINYSGLQGHIGDVRIARRDPGKHTFLLGFRGRYYIRQYELGFGYDYAGSRNYNSHSFTLTGGVSF